MRTWRWFVAVACVLSPWGVWADTPGISESQEDGIVSQARWDYAVGAGFRLAPLGAAAYGHAGYNLPLWGRAEPGEFKYGYARASSMLASSGLVTAGDVALELRPISILGITLRQGASYRLVGPASQAELCKTTLCRGWTQRTELRGDLIVGLGPLFTAFNTRAVLLSAQPAADQSLSPDSAIYDEWSALVGQGPRDILTWSEIAAGIRISDRWIAGAQVALGRMVNSGQTSETAQLFARWGLREWTAMAAAGVYRSSMLERSPTVSLLLEWAGGRSMAPR